MKMRTHKGKNYSKLIIAIMLAVIFSAGLSGCADALDFKGIRDEGEYEVGDVVLKDGTVIKNNRTLTVYQMSDSVAIIVRGKSGGRPALGVGIFYGENLAWCDRSAQGYSKISALQDTADGSRGWALLCSACSDAGKGNDRTLYPAWDFCNGYGDLKNLDDCIKGGWHLPSLSELKEVRDKWNTVSKGIEKCRGIAERNKFAQGNKSFWSGTQGERLDGNAWTVMFDDVGTAPADYGKNNQCYVLAVRVFD